MKISEALVRANKILNEAVVGSARLDAVIFMTQILSCSKEKIIFNPDLELGAAQQDEFFELVARRAKRVPTSQIIGKREFFGEDFFVNGDVLDPRPDSESLIEFVTENFPDKKRKLKILEVGVGSGCLIVTLARLYEMADGIGVDISEKALDVCKKNAQLHQVSERLKLLRSDLFAQVVGEKFDLVISNPPYIATAEIEDLEPEVRLYEPRTALDGGIDGLDFYRRIAAEVRDFLKENGTIILEIGRDQQEEIIEIFSAKKFQLTASKLDLSGVVRVLCFKNL